MLANTLNTNEVKDASGVEVEFSRISQGPGRTTEFAKVGESPYLPYRLQISHEEIGTGANMRRRSRVGFLKTIVGIGALGEPRKVQAYVVVDAPIGDLGNNSDVKHVIANLMSFLATTGAANTVLFDGTGNGAVVLANGDL
jgi:hypothetical protein